MRRESDYYIWLRDLTGNRKYYKKLIKQLDTIPYQWIFELDKNRAEGGKNLRDRFAYETSTNVDDVRTGPCTVLEMLIAVAECLVEQLSGEVSVWFWDLLGNLNLDEFDDENYDERYVYDIIDRWLNHEYTREGDGSIFPLYEYPGDCRNIDIWSQMNAWVNENYPSDDSWLY